MFEVDQKLTAYAADLDLIYTRYADDITFSSRAWLDRDQATRAVTSALSRASYTNLRLNTAKTVLVSDRFSRRVTGLVITPEKKVSLGRERKRLISSMVHHAHRRTLAPADWPRLAGLLAFAMDAEPTFIVTLKRKYPADLVDWILRWGTREIPGAG